MRECPQWFNDELARIGGVNQYGEPIFKLVWSTEPRTVIGGKWQKDGYEGYKTVPAVTGEPCWALMVWEPAELYGTYEQWNRDYRDPETGYLQCGGYPKYGKYRLLQKFIHREIVVRQKFQYVMQGKQLVRVPNSEPEVITYRMEPCGFMLDAMLPMLMRWRRLSNEAKTAALKQDEILRNEEYAKKAKDAREGTKMSRVMRSSQLVQKRAEIIEAGMKRAMAIAAHTGLGMRIGETWQHQA